MLHFWPYIYIGVESVATDGQLGSVSYGFISSVLVKIYNRNFSNFLTLCRFYIKNCKRYHPYQGLVINQILRIPYSTSGWYSTLFKWESVGGMIVEKVSFIKGKSNDMIINILVASIDNIVSNRTLS